MEDTFVNEVNVNVQFHCHTSLKGVGGLYEGVPDNQFEVPTKLTRLGLSEVVNHLLSLETHVPFDFLVNKEFLRGSLAQYLKRNDLSTETTVQLTYLLATPKPEEENELPHDDWVSAVDGRHPSALLTGCYDGLARLWSENGECIGKLSGHKDAITGVQWSLVPGKGNVIVTSSKDTTCRVWQVSEDLTATSTIAILAGHEAAVDSVVVSPNGQMCASGSWDTNVCLWKVPREDSNDSSQPGPSKRAKKGPSDTREAGKQLTTPLDTYSDHTQAVSCLSWPVASALYTGSHDHTIKQWDVSKHQVVTSLNSGKAVLALAGHPDTGLLASGHSDFHVRLWDPRSSDDHLVKVKFASHEGLVSSLSWSPNNEHHLFSASHDGGVKLFDTRTRLPIYTLRDIHDGKTLCVDTWKAGKTLVSGGTDNKVLLHNTRGGDGEE